MALSTRPPSPPPSPPGPAAAAPAAFQPQRLGKHALDVKITPLARDLSPSDRHEFAERELDLASRFDLTSPRNMRRWRHYLAGSAVAFPLLMWLLTPIGMRFVFFHLIAAAAFGTAMAFLRLRGARVGFALMSAAALDCVLSGHGYFLGRVLGVIALAVFFLLGLALGVSESLGRDGE